VARIDPELLSRDLSDADAQGTAEMAKAAPQAKIVRALRLFSDALAAARVSGNPRLELDTAVLRLVVQGEDPTLEALAVRVTLLERHAGETSEGGAVNAVAPAAVPEKIVAEKPKAKPEVQAAKPVVDTPSPGAPARPPEPTLQRVQSLWPSIRTRAEGEKVTLRAPLARAVVEAVSADAVVVRMTDEVNAGILRDHAAIMERALEEVMGVPLRLQVVARAEAGARARAPVQRAVAAPSGPPPEEGEPDLLAYALQKFTQAG
jgi:hypothetical protein